MFPSSKETCFYWRSDWNVHNPVTKGSKGQNFRDVNHRVDVLKHQMNERKLWMNSESKSVLCKWLIRRKRESSYAMEQNCKPRELKEHTTLNQSERWNPESLDSEKENKVQVFNSLSLSNSRRRRRLGGNRGIVFFYSSKGVVRVNHQAVRNRQIYY